MTEGQKHFFTRSFLLIIIIIVYFIFTSSIIQYQQEKKVTSLLYDRIKDWTPRTLNKSYKTIKEETRLVTDVDPVLSAELAGRILLQVEKNGEGWYVFPDDLKKYFLGHANDVYLVMRALGLGIKKEELKKYLAAKFPEKLSGKILLDVEGAGEAYYVKPDDLTGVYLGEPGEALIALKALGQGITNEKLRKIAVGNIE